MKNIANRESFLKKVYEYSQGIDDYIGMVDYTMLNIDATEKDIIDLCKRADDYGVATVCVRPNMVSLAKGELEGGMDSNVGVTTVISFPEGTNSLEEKISETKNAILDGADDIDMVLNYQMLKDAWESIDPDNPESSEGITIVSDELIIEVKTLVDICHNAGKILKVIVESGRLDEEQTEEVTNICIEAGADFIKTSTGMVEVGAELDKVKIFYNTIKEQGSDMLIKASGGIRTIEDVKKFAPYVDRFGIGSSSVDNMMGKGSGDSSY